MALAYHHLRLYLLLPSLSFQLYFITLVFVIRYLVKIIWEKKRDRMIQKAFLLFLVFNASLRFTFFIGWIVDGPECYPTVIQKQNRWVNFFSNIPGALYLTAFTLIVFTFSRIYHVVLMNDGRNRYLSYALTTVLILINIGIYTLSVANFVILIKQKELVDFQFAYVHLLTSSTSLMACLFLFYGVMLYTQVRKVMQDSERAKLASQHNHPSHDSRYIAGGGVYAGAHRFHDPTHPTGYLTSHRGGPVVAGVAVIAPGGGAGTGNGSGDADPDYSNPGPGHVRWADNALGRPLLESSTSSDALTTVGLGGNVAHHPHLAYQRSGYGLSMGGVGAGGIGMNLSVGRAVPVQPLSYQQQQQQPSTPTGGSRRNHGGAKAVNAATNALNATASNDRSRTSSTAAVGGLGGGVGVGVGVTMGTGTGMGIGGAGSGSTDMFPSNDTLSRASQPSPANSPMNAPMMPPRASTTSGRTASVAAPSSSSSSSSSLSSSSSSRAEGAVGTRPARSQSQTSGSHPSNSLHDDDDAPSLHGGNASGNEAMRRRSADLGDGNDGGCAISAAMGGNGAENINSALSATSRALNFNEDDASIASSSSPITSGGVQQPDSPLADSTSGHNLVRIDSGQLSMTSDTDPRLMERYHAVPTEGSLPVKSLQAAPPPVNRSGVVGVVLSAGGSGLAGSGHASAGSPIHRGMVPPPSLGSALRTANSRGSYGSMGDASFTHGDMAYSQGRPMMVGGVGGAAAAGGMVPVYHGGNSRHVIVGDLSQGQGDGLPEYDEDDDAEDVYESSAASGSNETEEVTGTKVNPMKKILQMSVICGLCMLFRMVLLVIMNTLYTEQGGPITITYFLLSEILPVHLMLRVFDTSTTGRVAAQHSKHTMSKRSALQSDRGLMSDDYPSTLASNTGVPSHIVEI